MRNFECCFDTTHERGEITLCLAVSGVQGIHIRQIRFLN
jgi:hypothetical protein